MNTVNSYKTYIHIDVALLSETQNPMKGSSFQSITYIGLTASREEKAFPISMLDLCYMCDTYI
jgi:hypothetical protein